MIDLADHLRTKLGDEGLTGQHLLLAVSGGPDSVALLRAACEVRSALKLELTAAHLNHRLRGTAADADAEWVAALCRRLDVPLALERQDVSSIAQDRGLSIEEAARQIRYEFLSTSALARDCSHVLVAHTADDQAETILHHILRGTGIAGLRGMGENRALGEGVVLYRPLLELSRQDILEYLDRRGQEARIDATNADPTFTRSRIRTQLLPMIQSEFNPQITRALIRLGRQAGEFSEVLDELVGQTLQRALVDTNATTCRIDCDALAGLPRHFVRECLKQAWNRQGWGLQRMGFGEWERLADLVTKGGAASLPHGVEARRRGKLLAMHRSSEGE